MEYGDIRRGGSNRMAELILKECPKTYILETHRSKSPEATHRFIEGMREHLGIRNFRNVSALDRIGIPVFTCHRIRPDESRTDHTGKGLSEIQAQVSLIMESIERYSSEFKNSFAPELIEGSFNSLRHDRDILNPEDLILPQFSKYTHDTVIHWVEGYDIVAGCDILVPAASVYHPFHLDREPLLHTHTNGIAAGNTMEEAVSHALAEVIERDAWSIARFTGEPRDALTLDDRSDNQFIINIIEKFAGAEIEIVAKDITSDIGVPVIAAFSTDLIYKKLMPIDGFGAHLDPKVALARALLEIVTTRGLFIQKFGLEDWKPSYQDDDVLDVHENDFRFYAFESKDINDLVQDYGNDILQDIQTMTAKLGDCGFERVIAVDLTRPDTEIPTVRVIVPGMEVYCFDRSRIGKRLFDALGHR